MKTHDFAKQLSLMAKILRAAPNTELSDLDMPKEMPQFSSTDKTVSKDDIPHALNMLVNLNKVSKTQWISLIEEFEFEIPMRLRDGNRDIMGKLLKYLSENPDERNRLTSKKSKKPIKASAELANALTILLK